MDYWTREERDLDEKYINVTNWKPMNQRRRAMDDISTLEKTIAAIIAACVMTLMGFNIAKTQDRKFLNEAKADLLIAQNTIDIQQRQLKHNVGYKEGWNACEEQF